MPTSVEICRLLRTIAVIAGVCFFSLSTVMAQEVTVTGMGTDRDGALRDASRRAVEQVVGTFISSQTLMKDFAIELDEVYKKSQGFVKYVTVLNESRLDDATYKVTAKVDSFNMSGMVDPMTAVQIGKLAGVKYLVAGSVTGLSTKSSGAAYSDTAWGGGGFNKNTVIANVTVRFIDVETGRIVLAASGTGESASTNMEFTLRKPPKEEYVNTTATDTVSGMETTEMIDTDGTNDIADITEETGTSDLGTETVEPIAENVPVVTTGRERKIIIGTKAFSQVQVRNALYKAVGDLIYNKNFGVLAKMDGKAKRRKV